MTTYPYFNSQEDFLAFTRLNRFGKSIDVLVEYYGFRDIGEVPHPAYWIANPKYDYVIGDGYIRVRVSLDSINYNNNSYELYLDNIRKVGVKERHVYKLFNYISGRLEKESKRKSLDVC